MKSKCCKFSNQRWHRTTPEVLKFTWPAIHCSITTTHKLMWVFDSFVATYMKPISLLFTLIFVFAHLLENESNTQEGNSERIFFYPFGLTYFLLFFAYPSVFSMDLWLNVHLTMETLCINWEFVKFVSMKIERKGWSCL